MKITELSYSYKTTIQMRQFEPVEISGYIRAQVDPSDKPERVMADLKKLINGSIDAEAMERKRQRMESFSDDASMEKVQ